MCVYFLFEWFWRLLSPFWPLLWDCLHLRASLGRALAIKCHSRFVKFEVSVHIGFPMALLAAKRSAGTPKRMTERYQSGLPGIENVDDIMCVSAGFAFFCLGLSWLVSCFLKWFSYVCCFRFCHCMCIALYNHGESSRGARIPFALRCSFLFLFGRLFTALIAQVVLGNSTSIVSLPLYVASQSEGEFKARESRCEDCSTYICTYMCIYCCT